jgi:hypothetical protein
MPCYIDAKERPEGLYFRYPAVTSFTKEKRRESGRSGPDRRSEFVGCGNKRRDAITREIAGTLFCAPECQDRNISCQTDYARPPVSRNS